MRFTVFSILALALAMLAAGMLRAQPATAPATAPAAAPTAHTTVPATQPSLSASVIVGLDGEINEFTRASVINRVQEARRLGASTVILRLNTPGGMVGPALEMTRFLKRQDDLRIIAYVDEMAYSAGAMIAMACDEIYMQPGSFMGDCAPIVPGQTLEGAERAKAESPLLAEFRDSAIRNGYDPLLAESMVQYSIVVYHLENEAGERRFVSDEEYQELRQAGWKPVPGMRNPVVGPNELLTVSADEAEQLNLSRGHHSSPQALASALGLEVIATLEPTGGERIIGFLSSSAVRGILGIVFILALLSAFRTPGMGYPEVIAVSSLALMVGVPLMTGYAQWYEILAIVIGVVLLAVELFVLPGFGLAGITGICLIIGGMVFTFVPAEPIEFPGRFLPTMPQTKAALKEGTLIVVGGMACALFLWLWLQRYLPRLPYANRLILTATVGGNAAVTTSDVPGAVEVIAWPAVGAVGEAVTDLRPGGAAEFHDDTIEDARSTDVVSDSGFIPRGTKVIVREVRGNRIVVRATA